MVPVVVGCQVTLPHSGAAGQAASSIQSAPRMMVIPRAAVMCSLVWVGMVSLLWWLVACGIDADDLDGFDDGQPSWVTFGGVKCVIGGHHVDLVQP